MKYRKLFLAVLIAALIYGAAAFVSYTNLHVANPVSSVTGLVQILLTDKEYVKIQNDPQVILSKPETSLEAYMEELGLEHNDEQQMGAIQAFSNGDYQEYVHYSVNQYFSRWSWISK